MDELENLSCITDMKIDDLTGEGNPQESIQYFLTHVLHYRSIPSVLVAVDQR
jgi:hypothetical protein